MSDEDRRQKRIQMTEGMIKHATAKANAATGKTGMSDNPWCTKCAAAVEQRLAEIDRMRSALSMALPALETAAQRFSGAKEALEAVKSAIGGKDE